MLSIAMEVAGLSRAPTTVGRIMPRFEEAAGKLIIEAVQSLLGTDEIYQLTERYKKRKPGLKGYKHRAGRPIHQPLILSGEHIFEALRSRLDGDTVIVEVDPAEGMDEDFDVAEYWESGEGSKRGFTGTHYLEKGLDMVEEQLPDLLLDIIVEELGL